MLLRRKTVSLKRFGAILASIDFIATHALGVAYIHKIKQSQTINLTLTDGYVRHIPY
jgi:hypothetical protein